jgi:hypothetical protein
VEHKGGLKMTRRGIEYNLTVSPYRFTNEYGLTFVFSSETHVKKFKERLKNNRIKLNESLSNRFNFYIEFNSLSDIVLYRQIEQRGFLIIKGGENLLCQNSIKLDGERVITKP